MWAALLWVVELCSTLASTAAAAAAARMLAWFDPDTPQQQRRWQSPKVWERLSIVNEYYDRGQGSPLTEDQAANENPHSDKERSEASQHGANGLN